MKRFGRSAFACRSAACLTVAPVSNASFGETSSETKPSTPSVRSCCGLEQVGGPAQVGDRHLEEERLGVEALLAQLVHLVVVGVAGGDRLLEDRRVRRQARDRELVDVALQRPVVEHRAGDVVQPEALAEIVELLRGLHLDDLLGGLDHLVWGEAELRHRVLERGRGAERVHSDRAALLADITVPTEGRRLLDRDARGHGRWQHLVAVGLVLAVEDFPAGQADHARGDAVGHELVVGLERERDLAAGRKQDHVGVARLDVCDHVAALARSLRCRVLRAVDDRHVLAGQHEGDGLVASVHRHAPGLGGLVGIGGADHVEAGNGAKARELLDGLVGRTVLAKPDRVVGENMDNRQFH